MAHGPQRALAGPRAVPRRPGLRRRDHRGDAGVHRVTPRHRAAAGQGAQGLRGVRPPLPARLERPAEPLAALHAAEPDDLRRPRRARRLEHLATRGSRRSGHHVVARAASSPASRRTGSTSTSATSRPTSARRTRSGSGCVAHEGEDELDLDARRWTRWPSGSTQEPGTYRWSYARDLADVRPGRGRLRAARVLEPDRRALLDDAETRLARRADARRRQAPAGRHVAAVPAAAGPAPPRGVERGRPAGAWGERAGNAGEKLRRTVDLEHWGAFQDAFQAVARMATEVADGKRGKAPQTVTFLSGDVHHSYVSEVQRQHWAGSSRIMQAVCSPIRNPLPRKMRFATAVAGLCRRRPDRQAGGPLGEGAGRAVPLAQRGRARGSTTTSRCSRTVTTACCCRGSPVWSSTATTCTPGWTRSPRC